MERENVIEMQSLTAALAARNALFERGIKAAVVRSGKSRNGCGYALKIPGDISAAKKILSAVSSGGST